MIMQLKLFLLLIGLCVISCHQATAENEEGMLYVPSGIMGLRYCTIEFHDAKLKSKLSELDNCQKKMYSSVSKYLQRIYHIVQLLN